MKKQQNTRRLTLKLNRETLRALTQEQVAQVNGGFTVACPTNGCSNNSCVRTCHAE